MKWLIRGFFKTIRIILGPFMLLMEMLTTPKPVERSEKEQAQLDQQTASLALYQYRTCPFCIKARKAIHGLSLNIELRDAQKNNQHRQDLLELGGQIKVPCLRIHHEQGDDTWLYESDDIIAYLNKRFSPDTHPVAS